MLDPQKFYEVAMTFQVLVESGINEVDMCNGETFETGCGAPCCHGGWFEYASFPKARSIMGCHYFTAGSNSIAYVLGFDGASALEDWAIRNPNLWGNENGYVMFSNRRAFGKSPNAKLTLKDISNHWYEVADRVADAIHSEKQRAENE